MKKFLKFYRNIVVSLLAIVFFTQSILPVDAWKRSDHALMLEEVVVKYNINNMSDKEKRLLYECSKLPDEKQYRHIDPSNKNVTVSTLHGRKNYIITLRYLQEISYKYLKNTEKEGYVGETIDKYFKSCTYIAPYKKDIEKLNISLKSLLEEDVLKTQDSYEKSNRKKAIKIMGFACHLIGDTFAHVSIVPMKQQLIKETDFKDSKKYPKYTAKFKYQAFKDIVKRFEIPFADLAKLNVYKYRRRGESTGEKKYLAEYPDLLKDGGKRTEANNKALLESISEDFKTTADYEDNVNLYRGRVRDTKRIMRIVLEKFNADLKKRDNGENYNANFNINLYDGCELKLKQYESYKAEAGK